MTTTTSAQLITFTATLTFKTHTEQFNANRVKLQEFITPSGAFWVFKGFEDTINPTTQSKAINSLQFYLNKTDGHVDLALVPPEVLPKVAANSAGYYKLEDSPDDQDEEMDAAYAFPCTQGTIHFARLSPSERYVGSFKFDVEAPNLETFHIEGVFEVEGSFEPIDLR
jgi:hypothetical protein